MTESTKTGVWHGGGFKTRVAHLEKEIKKGKGRLEKLVKAEEKSRGVWTKAYHSFMDAVGQLADLKVHGTKRETRLKKKIHGWPSETARLTEERDGLRAQIKEGEKVLVELGTQLTRLMEQQTNEVGAINEIVTQVFELNESVVRASRDRENCLNRHVFPRLIDEHGDLCSQLSFTSSDGKRRVVAMVNTMTIVRGDLAASAKAEIQQFFDRYQKVAKMDDAVKPLYDLTRQLLVEKTEFKVGPDLYRFLAMNLDEEIFPELASAQTLLRQSIRSEKTNSYIRIYERASATSNWEVVGQS